MSTDSHGFEVTNTNLPVVKGSADKLDLALLTYICRGKLAPEDHLEAFEVVAEAAKALGETTSDVVEALILISGIYEAMEKKAKKAKEKADGFKKRVAGKRSAIRDLYRKLLSDEGLQKLKTLNGWTVNIVQGKDSFEVIDVEAVEEEFASYTKRGNKRTALDHFKATGEIPPGFGWIRGPDYTTVRTPSA